MTTLYSGGRHETFEIPGCPVPWRAPVVTRNGNFSRNTGFIRAVRDTLEPWFPLSEKPIALHAVFVMPIPKSFSRKKRQLAIEGKIKPITRPDRTNMLKLFEDIFTGIIYKDDSQVVSGDASKEYGENPRTIILIYEIEEA